MADPFWVSFLSGTTVAVTGAAITGGVVGLKKLLAGQREAAKTAAHVLESLVQSDKAMTARLDAQDETLQRIDGEVHTNGGNSLKDFVIKSAAQSQATAGKLQEHLDEARYRQGRVDEFMKAHPPSGG